MNKLGLALMAAQQRALDRGDPEGNCLQPTRVSSKGTGRSAVLRARAKRLLRRSR